MSFGKTHSSCIQETPSCTSTLQASFTVEAAVVLPVFLCCMTVVLFFFRVMQVQLEVEAALHETARQQAVCMHYKADAGRAVNLAASVTLFQNNVKDCAVVKSFVTGSTAGISLAQSEYSEEKVELVASYWMKVPFSMFGAKKLHLIQRTVCNAWTGRQSTDPTPQYVYVTETGTVYHLTRDCRYLDLHIQPAAYDQITSLRNEGGSKYQPCEKCGAEAVHSNTVYITDYGKSYHTSLSCSGLKRTVYIILRSEAGDRRACSKCG